MTLLLQAPSARNVTQQREPTAGARCCWLLCQIVTPRPPAVAACRSSPTCVTRWAAPPLTMRRTRCAAHPAAHVCASTPCGPRRRCVTCPVRMAAPRWLRQAQRAASHSRGRGRVRACIRHGGCKPSVLWALRYPPPPLLATLYCVQEVAERIAQQPGPHGEPQRSHVHPQVPCAVILAGSGPHRIDYGRAGAGAGPREGPGVRQGRGRGKGGRGRGGGLLTAPKADDAVAAVPHEHGAQASRRRRHSLPFTTSASPPSPPPRPRAPCAPRNHVTRAWHARTHAQAAGRWWLTATAARPC